MSGFSIQVATFEEWYCMAGEFFRGCEGASLEQIDAGHKALTLAYFGLKESPSAIEEVKAWAIFQLAGKKLLAAEMEAREA